MKVHEVSLCKPSAGRCIKLEFFFAGSLLFNFFSGCDGEQLLYNIIVLHYILSTKKHMFVGTFGEHSSCDEEILWIGLRIHQQLSRGV